MGNVGGQALIDGVMMKGDNYISRAVYSETNNLIVDRKEFHPLSEKIKLLKLPVIRGFVSLIEMLIIGTDSLMYSANISGAEIEQISKKELSFSMMISFGFAIALFIIAPAMFFTYIRNTFTNLNLITLNLLEGLFRISIFTGFLISTLFMKDMREVYAYHGAEHKAVNTFEKKEELTIETVQKNSRIHFRCGTSFIMVVFLVSVLVFALFGRPTLLARIGLKLTFLPLVSGISYEIIRFAAKHDKNILFKIVLLPGLLMQLITTKEPNEKQMNAAIHALKEVV